MYIDHLPGSLTQTAHFLSARSFVIDVRLAMGGAVALHSSLAADNYVIRPPTAARHLDGNARHRVVTQSVGLVGPVSSGKGSMIAGVEQLASLIGIGERVVKYRRTADAVFLLAHSHQGVLWIEDNNTHHALAAHERGDKEVSRLLAHLHVGREPLDKIERPFSTRRADIPPYIRPTRFTFLTESTPHALQNKLPSHFEWSPFYGDLLWVRAQEHRLRNPYPKLWPQPELVERLKTLAQRPKTAMVEVRFTEEAFETVRLLFWQSAKSLVDGVFTTQRVHRTVNVAALVAIGIDNDHPVIDMDLVVAAAELASDGHELMMSGLEQDQPVLH